MGEERIVQIVRSYLAQRKSRKTRKPTDPWRYLCQGLLAQAVVDIALGTPLEKLDALVFLMQDGAQWLEYSRLDIKKSIKYVSA